MSQNHENESKNGLLNDIARCLELRSDFEALNDTEQLILQVYIGDIIKLPLSETKLFRSQLEVFLDNLNESWPEAFSRLAAALAVAPASISETLTNASCANIQRPIANFVTIAVEKLIWNRLFIGKDDDVKRLIKLLEIPTEYDELFFEARSLLDAQDGVDLHRCLFVFASLLSKNTPKRIIDAIKNIQLHNDSPSVFHAARDFWTFRPLRSSLYRSTNDRRNSESIAACVLGQNILSLLPQLDATRRFSLIIGLIQCAVELHLPLCDIHLDNVTCPNLDTINNLLEISPLPPCLRNVIQSHNKKTPLPRISRSIESISVDFLSHFGFQSHHSLNENFVKHGMIKPGQSVIDTVKSDLEILRSIDLDALSDRFEACIRQAWISHINQVLRDREQDPQTAAKLYPNHREYSQNVLELFSQSTSELMPFFKTRTLICGIYVSGDHHRDPFHPHVDTFSLASDWVRGSSDVLIVNTRLSKLFSNTLETEAVESLLAERFNAKAPADWEADPGVIYCSDMSPYLFRIASFLQGAGCRYRIDPLKLSRVLELI